MAKTKSTTAHNIDEPNVRIPLAFSYNQRGIDSNTNLWTNALDQRKINCTYDVVQNSLSGTATTYLTKRPGVASVGGNWGTGTQVAYLLELAPGALAISNANHWVISKNGNDIRASDNSTTTVIDSTAGYAPVYIDKTIIAGADTAILQTRNASGTSLVWYSSAIATWTQISDSDFTSLVLKGKMEFLDGYAFALTSTNQINNSSLNTLATWDATNYITKQIVQDTPVALARLNKLLVAFGMSTMEVFHDVGNATGSPLENLADRAIKGVGMDPVDGTYQRNYYTVHNNALYFVGRNPKGLFMYNGERVEKVSPPAMDRVLASGNFYNVSMVSYSGKAAVCINMTDPTQTTQNAVLFFPEWKDWFQWTTTVFQPVTTDRLGHTFLGIGASSTGDLLYRISETSNNWQDAGTNFTETIQFKLPSQGNHYKHMPMCGVIGDTARSASSLNVSFSDDDGQNWSTARTIDMTAPAKNLMGCGRFRDRQVRITHTGNEENRLEAFIARID